MIALADLIKGEGQDTIISRLGEISFSSSTGCEKVRDGNKTYLNTCPSLLCSSSVTCCKSQNETKQDHLGFRSKWEKGKLSRRICICIFTCKKVNEQINSTYGRVRMLMETKNGGIYTKL